MSEPTSGKSEDSVAVPGILLVLLSKSRFPLLKLLSATFSALLLLFGFLFATAGAAIWLMRTSRLELPGVKLLAATQQAIVPAAAGWVPVNPNPGAPGQAWVRRTVGY